jgi:exodeoxyribonuclease V gamma subunit
MVDGLRLHGAVSGLRSKGGEFLQLDLRPGALVKDKRLRFDKLVMAWVTQVCLEAMGRSVQTVFCGPDETRVLPSIGRDAALAQVREWVEAFKAGWPAPLPIACKTAFEYLRPTRDKDEDYLAEVFEGNERYPGERGYSPSLRRSFEAYDEIQAGIERWAKPLYGRLADALAPESGE